MEIRSTSVLSRNLHAYLQGASIIINQGGQGSSKTWSILQLLYRVAKAAKEPLIITICSYALPHLKLGAIRDFQKILTMHGENIDKIHNKTDHFFRIGNSTVEYFGIRDNYAKVHGPRRDILFINECNNKITYDDFDHLNQRTHICSFLDFNPRSSFWVHEDVMPFFYHEFIKSTYRDNPYLPDAELQKILSKKDNPKFAAWWKVYGDGEIGAFEGLIFTEWEFSDFPDDVIPMYGLDFGFFPSPDAMIKTNINHKEQKMHWSECFYRHRLKPSELKTEVGLFVNREMIIADSADQRMINDLRQQFRIQGISKRGTVGEWLRLMQDYTHYVTPDSANLIKEFGNYVWLDEKEGVPIDDHNHLIDPGRYTFMYSKHSQLPTKAYG